MIDPRRLDAIRKLRNDASYGYATVTSQVYAKDIQELLTERDDLLADIARQRARADLAEHAADKLRRVLKSIADNEISVQEATALTANPKVEIIRGPMGVINAPGIGTDVLEGGD